MPVLHRSRERYAALAELAADDAAVRASGRPGPLAAALLAFDANGGPAGGVASERVDHLAGQRSSWQVPMRDVMSGIATIGVLGIVISATALASTGEGLERRGGRDVRLHVLHPGRTGAPRVGVASVPAAPPRRRLTASGPHVACRRALCCGRAAYVRSSSRPLIVAYRLGAGVDHPKVEEIWEVFGVAS